MPSASMTRVSVRRASSSRRDRSAEERASRGDLQPEDRADFAQTHPRNQRFEPVAALGRSPGDPQIRIDHLDATPQANPAATPRKPGRTDVRWTRWSRTWANVDWRT